MKMEKAGIHRVANLIIGHDFQLVPCWKTSISHMKIIFVIGIKQKLKQTIYRLAHFGLNLFSPFNISNLFD